MKIKFFFLMMVFVNAPLSAYAGAASASSADEVVVTTSLEAVR